MQMQTDIRCHRCSFECAVLVCVAVNLSDARPRANHIEAEATVWRTHAS